MVDMSSDFGDLDDDDLLQLTEEFEGSTAATDTRAAIIVDTPARGAAADVDGLEDSPSSAKRRRVGSSPFKKPQLPRSRLNKGQNKISLVLRREVPSPGGSLN
ncbi:hypothetical protein KEM54_005049 [Ascosphaera aggregata]|nr:hypothetical protein KEM54_005049 [Ascosphaera aggregata]